MSTTERERLRAVLWRDLLELSAFYHVEHHLFPAVPTCKVPILARRLDDVAPAMTARRVF
jgi:fatty acid desaturase